jgi:hypothetical protein
MPDEMPQPKDVAHRTLLRKGRSRG